MYNYVMIPELLLNVFYPQLFEKLQFYTLPDIIYVFGVRQFGLCIMNQSLLINYVFYGLYMGNNYNLIIEAKVIRGIF